MLDAADALEDRNFLDAIDALAADSMVGEEGQVCGPPPDCYLNPGGTAHGSV